ncbi:MAG: hypothetical protein AAF436_17430 [Myxococcota bacterium]
MKNKTVVVALVVALSGWSCGDGGGEITGEAGLQSVMQAIALDLAAVLDEIAPSDIVPALKGAGNTADCNDGGTANWLGASQGTLTFADCTLRGITLNGSLVGFLSSEFGNLSANGLQGFLMISGGATADLNVQRLIVSASLPITDAGTFWEIEAITEENELICAWSGGGPCQSFF